MRLWSKLDRWTDVAVFENETDAKSLETFLSEKALPSRIYDDKLFRLFLFLRPPKVTYRVQVAPKDFPAVDKILETESPEMLRRAIRCPSCGSLRISYPQMTRKFVLPTILLHLGIIFRFIEHECYCDHCHFVWNLPHQHLRFHFRELFKSR